MVKKYNQGEFICLENEEESTAFLLLQGRAEVKLSSFHDKPKQVAILEPGVIFGEMSKYRIEQSMDIAQELQVKGVILHTNMIPGFNIPSYVEGWIESNEFFLRKVLEKYNEINIYMENMFDTSPDILAELASRMKDVENFGICFDVAHGNISPTPMEKWFEKLAPYIKHLHINDNDGISDLHRPVGKGKLDWNKFKEQIRQNSIESSILVEVSSCKAAQDSLMYMKKRGIYPFYGDENL